MDKHTINIEAVRGQLMLTKEQLAKKLGISVNSYDKRIRKEVEWKASEVHKLSEWSGIPVELIDYLPNEVQ